MDNPKEYWNNYLDLNDPGKKRFKKLGIKLFNIVPHTCELERLFSLDSLFKNSHRTSLMEYRSFGNSIIHEYLKEK